MFFEKTYRPIPLAYNLVLAMLWRHPEKVELDKVKVVHYCAAVSPFAISRSLLSCIKMLQRILHQLFMPPITIHHKFLCS